MMVLPTTAGGFARWWLCLTAASLLVVRFWGRTLFGAPECFGLWTGQVDGPEASQFFLDPYTFVHLTCGMVVYVAVSRNRTHHVTKSIWARAAVVVLGQAVWEVFENSNPVIRRYRVSTISAQYSGDSLVNSFSDDLVTPLGFFLAASFCECEWRAESERRQSADRLVTRPRNPYHDRLLVCALIVVVELLVFAGICDNFTFSVLGFVVPSRHLVPIQAACRCH